MRFINLSPSLNRLTRLLTSISVRTRIVVLALIPVAGFLANGLTYVSGERDVATAFQTVRKSAEVADASRDFKSAVAQIRLVVKDFSAAPSTELVINFALAHSLALKNLDTIEAAVDRKTADFSGLRKNVMDLRDNFNELVQQQNVLGFDEKSGLRGMLGTASNAIERIINENMTWIAEGDANKLMMALLLMRQYEADYRLSQSELAKQEFLTAYKQFTGIFGNIDGTPEMKDALERQVKSYADTFKQWGEAYDRAYPLRKLIDIDSQNMLPLADKIIAQARKTTDAATSELIVSQAHTRTGILAVGFAMVAFGLGFSWLIGRSITRPLNGLSGVMQRLADGDTSARIPATDAHDEIGEMARTVIVFRDTMVEREKLAAIQADASRTQAQRSDTIAFTIAQFKHSVESALGKLRGASMKLEMSSSDLNKSADTMSAEARTAEQRVAAASDNVTAAASSVEELAASIGEIASQAAKSTDVAGRAVSEAQRTVTTMSELGSAATRIGEVVGLIQAIAGQTNLLALNATIEAARAGDCRQGFRGGRLGSEIAGRADRQSNRRDRRANRLDPVGRRRRCPRDRTGQRHHQRHVVDRHHGGGDRRPAEFRGRLDRGRRQPRLRRGAQRRRGDEQGRRRHHRRALDRLRRQGPGRRGRRRGGEPGSGSAPVPHQRAGGVGIIRSFPRKRESS